MEGEQVGTSREADEGEEHSSAAVEEGVSAGSSGQQQVGKKQGLNAQESLVSEWAII